MDLRLMSHVFLTFEIIKNDLFIPKWKRLNCYDKMHFQHFLHKLHDKYWKVLRISVSQEKVTKMCMTYVYSPTIYTETLWQVTMKAFHKIYKLLSHTEHHHHLITFQKPIVLKLIPSLLVSIKTKHYIY